MNSKRPVDGDWNIVYCLRQGFEQQDEVPQWYATVLNVGDRAADI